MAGANQSQIMDKMNKNAKYLKNQKIFTKIIMAIYLGLMILVPILSMIMIREASRGEIAMEQLLLASSGMMSSFFLIQLFYLLMFGLFTSTGLFTPESYKWLTTLPIENRSLSKIGLFTLFRSLNVQSVVMMLIFPMAIIIVTQNLFIFLIALLISVLNTGFAMTLLIILGAKFTKVINNNAGNQRGSTLIRIMVILGYLIGTLMATMSIQFITPIMENILSSQNLSATTLGNWNQWLALIPFPLSGSYLVSMLFLGISNFSTAQFIRAILGLILMVIWVYRLTNRALKNFLEAIKPDDGKKNEKTITSTVEDVQISTLKQMGAFFKKDAQNITRDIQSLMFVLMPVILPSLAYIVLASSVETMDFAGLYIVSILYMFLGAFMMVMGTIGIENTGASILASLPIVIREQAKAKILWVLIILPIANLLPTLFFLTQPFYLEMFLTTLIIIPMGIIFGVSVLEMHAFLFGKMKYKYVLDEVRIKNKVGKIILMAGIGLVICIGFMILTAVLMEDYSIGMMLLVLGGVELILGIGVYFIFNKMFPKMEITSPKFD